MSSSILSYGATLVQIVLEYNIEPLIVLHNKSDLHNIALFQREFFAIFETTTIISGIIDYFTSIVKSSFET